MDGSRPIASAQVHRAASRALAVAMLLLQALAPWLHAHTSAARTVGFHLHIGATAAAAAPASPGAATPSRARPPTQARWAQAAASLLPGDEPGIGMPGAWLREAESPVDDPPRALAAMRAAPGAAAEPVQRVGSLDAARPPPRPRPLRAYLAHAPPAAATVLPSRG